jgi:hypothetical protein
LALPNYFNKKSDHIVEIPVLVKLNSTVDLGSTKVTPEVRLGYTFVAKRPDNDLTVGFVGSGLRTTIHGVKPPRGSFQAGLGAKFEVGPEGNFDIFVNYDVDVARRYVNHNAILGVGFSF